MKLWCFLSETSYTSQKMNFHYFDPQSDFGVHLTLDFIYRDWLHKSWANLDHVSLPPPRNTLDPEYLGLGQKTLDWRRRFLSNEYSWITQISFGILLQIKSINVEWMTTVTILWLKLYCSFLLTQFQLVATRMNIFHQSWEIVRLELFSFISEKMQGYIYKVWLS